MPILHGDARRLARGLWTAAAYRALDQTEARGGTGCEGGCALLAFALSNLIRGSTVMALCAPRTKPQHLVVRLPEGRYVDGDGISTRRALLWHWRWIEHHHGPITLRRSTLSHLDRTEIPHDPQDIAIIRAFLARTLYPPIRQGDPRGHTPDLAPIPPTGSTRPVHRDRMNTE
jgi:hypothetical protein